MELEVIISLIMLVATVLLFGIISFKKSKSSGTDDFLQLYLIEIIRIAQTAINTLKVDRNNYEDDESYKLALASYVAGELRILLEKTNINTTLLKVLTVEVITDFIYSSFDMISDVTGYNKQLQVYHKKNKK